MSANPDVLRLLDTRIRDLGMAAARCELAVCVTGGQRTENCGNRQRRGRQE